MTIRTDHVGGERATRAMPAWTLALPVVVVLLAATVASGLVLLNRSPRAPWVAGGTAAVGAKAVDFSSWDLKGDPVKLSDLAGRPVLLTFWATWCTACHDEFPTLQRLEDHYGQAGLTVLAVDYREADSGAMQRFLDRLNVRFQAVIDPNGAIASAYGVDIGLPVNVWIDRSQTVTQVMLGEKQAADLEAAAASIDA